MVREAPTRAEHGRSSPAVQPIRGFPQQCPPMVSWMAPQQLPVQFSSWQGHPDCGQGYYSMPTQDGADDDIVNADGSTGYSWHHQHQRPQYQCPGCTPPQSYGQPMSPASSVPSMSLGHGTHTPPPTSPVTVPMGNSGALPWQGGPPQQPLQPLPHTPQSHPSGSFGGDAGVCAFPSSPCAHTASSLYSSQHCIGGQYGGRCPSPSPQAGAPSAGGEQPQSWSGWQHSGVLSEPAGAADQLPERQYSQVSGSDSAGQLGQSSGSLGAAAFGGVVRPCARELRRHSKSLSVELRDGRHADASSEVAYEVGTRLIVELPGGAKDVARVLGPGTGGRGEAGYTGDRSLLGRGVLALRKVTEEEASVWDLHLDEDEAIALAYLRERQQFHGTEVRILRAEAQYDRQKLTIHYSVCEGADKETVQGSESFRALLRDAGLRFFCRVRMQEHSGTSPAGSASQ